MSKSTQKAMTDGELDPVAELKLAEECLNLRKSARVQQQLPSDPASTKHEGIHCLGFHPRGDVNGNTCERRSSEKPLRGVEQILHAK